MLGSGRHTAIAAENIEPFVKPSTTKPKLLRCPGLRPPLEVRMDQTQCRELARDRLVVAQVVRHERKVVHKTAGRCPKIVDAPVLEAADEASTQSCPVVDHATVSGDHDAGGDVGLECCRSALPPLGPDRKNLELADHCERHRKRVASDQRGKLPVPALLQVDERERIGVDGKWPVWDVSRSHLAEFGEGGHERISLIVCRLGVVQNLRIGRSASVLPLCKIRERELTPEFARVEA